MVIKQKGLFPAENFFKYEKPQPIDVPKASETKGAEQFLTDEEYYNKLAPAVRSCLNSADYAIDTPGYYNQVLKEAGFKAEGDEYSHFVQKIKIITHQIIARRKKTAK